MINRKHPWTRAYFIVLGVLSFVNWFLLWARFLGSGINGVSRSVFRILNFPLGNAYLWIEAKSNPWWNETFGTSGHFIFNDEIGPFLALVILCLAQAAIYFLLFSGLRGRAMKIHRGIAVLGFIAMFTAGAAGPALAPQVADTAFPLPCPIHPPSPMER